MRKLLWMIILFGAYIWAMTSGHEQFILNQGKKLLEMVYDWFEDAEVDFQLKKQNKLKKRSRRWD